MQVAIILRTLQGICTSVVDDRPTHNVTIAFACVVATDCGQSQDVFSGGMSSVISYSSVVTGSVASDLP